MYSDIPALPIDPNCKLILGRFRVAVERNDCSNRVWGRTGQTAQPGPPLILIYFHGLPIGIERCRKNLLLESADSERVTGPEVRVKEKLLALTREESKLGPLYLAGIGPMDEVAVAVHPFSNGGEDFNGRLWYGTIRARSDVEEVIASVSGAG